MIDLESITKDQHSRRTFLSRMSAAGLGIVAASLLGKSAFASGKPVLELVNVPDNGHMPGIPGRSKN
jgi:hypothetical protein